MPVSVAFSFSHTNNTYNTVMIFMLLKTETKQKVESEFFIIYFNLKETHNFPNWAPVFKMAPLLRHVARATSGPRVPAPP